MLKYSLGLPEYGSPIASEHFSMSYSYWKLRAVGALGTMATTYHPPLLLTIIGTIFIGLTTLVAAWITFDIVVRRGWKIMIAVM